MWNFHVGDFAEGKYIMILGKDLITALGLDIKLSENVIIGGDGKFDGCFSTMFDVGNYNFTSLIYKTVKPEELFIKLYVDECIESDSMISSTWRMCRIIDDE